MAQTSAVLTFFLLVAASRVAPPDNLDIVMPSLVQSGKVRKNPPYRDRAGFHHAYSQIREGAASAEVIRLLGEPDDIRRGRDELNGFVADEVWCYGTDRHMGFPTLGLLSIAKGKVYWINTQGTPAPFTEFMPEPRLRSVLRQLGEGVGSGFEEPSDPLWMVRSANILIDLGHDEAVDVLDELITIAGADMNFDALAMLMRLIFEVPTPPGYTKDWMPNFGLKEVRTSFTKMPRFPMIVVDDVPFILDLGGRLSSGMPPGWGALDYYRKFPIRTRRLKPANDPFASCTKLITSPEWPFPNHPKDEKRFVIPFKENEGQVLQQVLRLVRDAYQPVDFRTSYSINGLDLGKYHSAFAKLGAHWDSEKERYVRRDGVILVQKGASAVQHWNPSSFNHRETVVSLQRFGDSDQVNVSYWANDLDRGPFQPEALLLIDATTDKLTAWMTVRASNEQTRFRQGRKLDKVVMDKYLAGPVMKRDKSQEGASFQVTIKNGAKIRLELITSFHRERSPVLKI